MEITEELRNLTFELHEELTAFIAPTKKGVIINLASLSETEIDDFMRESRPGSKTYQKKPFSEKVDALEQKFSESSNLKNEKLSIITFLRALIAIRNFAGHNHSISILELGEIKIKHPIISDMLADFPRQLSAAHTTFRLNLIKTKNENGVEPTILAGADRSSL